MANKIVEATVGKPPESVFGPLPEVIVKMEDGTTQILFDFFPDEISFTSEELVGLTVEEAIALKGQKDLAYLRS